MQRKLRIWSSLSCSDNRKPVLSFAEGSAIQKRPRRPKWLGLSIIACVLVVARAAAEAQLPNKIYRIGVLTNVPRSSRIEAFRQGMKELGYVEGKHFTLEIRRAEEKPDQHPKFAAELVGLPVDVIVADSTALTNAARNATKTIPIVMQAGNPVAAGLVASLAHPGGNITGLTSMSGELGGKTSSCSRRLPPRFPAWRFRCRKEKTVNSI